MSRRFFAAIMVAALSLAGLLWLLPEGFAPGQRPGDRLAAISDLQMSAAEVQQTVNEVLALTLPDLAGHPQSIAQWRGKILVVNYWASWCTPCIEEMPAFSRLQTRYAEQGVQFVGIGIDELVNMRAFIKKTPVAYPLLLAELGKGQQAGQQVKGLPYTLIIDQQGKLAESRLGRFDEAALEKILQKLLRESNGR
ncbi:MAG TPA: TlpA disulfide reductase family protein [Accumulibacter sp.]|nr:TlpA disulfide reductase family protein [Accumulibacter sp.]